MSPRQPRPDKRCRQGEGRRGGRERGQERHGNHERGRLVTPRIRAKDTRPCRDDGQHLRGLRRRQRHSKHRRDRCRHGDGQRDADRCGDAVDRAREAQQREDEHRSVGHRQHRAQRGVAPGASRDDRDQVEEVGTGAGIGQCDRLPKHQQASDACRDRDGGPACEGTSHDRGMLACAQRCARSSARQNFAPRLS